MSVYFLFFRSYRQSQGRTDAHSKLVLLPERRREENNCHAQIDMEVTTARDAKKLIDDAVASGKMSEEVHKSLSSYLEKKVDCDLNYWCESCSGEDEVNEQTTHVAAHYIGTSYFKIPPGLEDPVVKYDTLIGDGAGMTQLEYKPTVSAIEGFIEFPKWPLKIKFLKGDEVPDDVLDKEKETVKAKRPKSKGAVK